MEKITKEMYVCEVLDMGEDIRNIFLKHDLNCEGCPGANTETIEEAAEGHGIDLEKLLLDLNKRRD